MFPGRKAIESWVLSGKVKSSVTITTWKRYSLCIYLELFVGGRMLYLRYLCFIAYSSVQYILCCCFDFLRLVYHVLPISLDCLFLIAPSVFSNVYLQFLWIVYFWLPHRYSLTLIYSFSGLSIFDCPISLWCFFLILHA